ncbi:unnamed protein product, partial [marine sediment metagenome]
AAETIRTRVEEMFGVTVSIGIATFPDNTKNVYELRPLADATMYISKKNGGNQTNLCDKIPVSE